MTSGGPSRSTPSVRPFHADCGKLFSSQCTVPLPTGRRWSRRLTRGWTKDSRVLRACGMRRRASTSAGTRLRGSCVPRLSPQDSCPSLPVGPRFNTDLVSPPPICNASTTGFENRPTDHGSTGSLPLFAGRSSFRHQPEVVFESPVCNGSITRLEDRQAACRSCLRWNTVNSRYTECMSWSPS